MQRRINQLQAVHHASGKRSSFSWVRLGYGEVLAPPVPSQTSLLVILAGGGTILGDIERAVAKDDVIALSAGCKYGVIGGPNALYALTIQCGEGSDAGPWLSADVRETETGLNALNASSQRRLRLREGSEQ
jgi:hypothetical protein